MNDEPEAVRIATIKATADVACCRAVCRAVAAVIVGLAIALTAPLVMRYWERIEDHRADQVRWNGELRARPWGPEPNIRQND